MNRALSAMVFLLAFGLSMAGRPLADDVTIVMTSDIHGHLKNKCPMFATFVKETRETDGDIVLIDVGDFLQGTVASYFANTRSYSGLHGLSRLFSYLHYDALVPGNHDFEFGRKKFERIADETGIPVLNANIKDKKTQQLLYNPYTIIERGDKRIAVLGMLSPDILSGTPSGFRASIEVDAMMETAKHWVDIIRKEEKPDMLILAVHDGFEAVDDNPVYKIVKEVDGIDLCFAAHSHITVDTVVVSNFGKEVPVLETRPRLLEAAIVKVKIGNKRTNIVSKEIVPIQGFKNDEAYIAYMKDFLDAVEQFASKPICHIDTLMNPMDALKGPSVWATLMHDSVLSWAEKSEAKQFGIDASLMTVFFEKKPFGGDVRFIDFLQMEPYNDQLCLVELTALELKLFLEYNYDRVFSHNSTAYYCDDLYGVYYTVYPNRPDGKRVAMGGDETNPRYYSGTVYHVLMPSFRAHDGGEVLSRVLKWTPEKIESRILWESDSSILGMIVDYCQDKGNISLVPQQYWKIDESTE